MMDREEKGEEERKGNTPPEVGRTHTHTLTERETETETERERVTQRVRLTDR